MSTRCSSASLMIFCRWAEMSAVVRNSAITTCLLCRKKYHEMTNITSGLNAGQCDVDCRLSPTPPKGGRWGSLFKRQEGAPVLLG